MYLVYVKQYVYLFHAFYPNDEIDHKNKEEDYSHNSKEQNSSSSRITIMIQNWAFERHIMMTIYFRYNINLSTL